MAVVLVGAICIGLVAISSDSPVDVIAGLPLAIYLPGAVLVLAIDVGRRHLGLLERQVWTVAASIGLAVIGGLVLNLAWGLTRVSWLVWMSGVICVCAVVGGVRIRRQSSEDGALPDDNTSELHSHPRFQVSLRQGLLLATAVIVCGAALTLSIHSNAVSTRENFVQSWVLPQPVDTVSSPDVQVGIMNHLGSKRAFVIHVTVGTGRTAQFMVTLGNGATWKHKLVRHPGEQVESAVATAARPSFIISRVYLAHPVDGQ
jgi:uncharacterized membrane protein